MERYTPIFHLSSLLLITPFYDFKNHRVVNTKFGKIYTVIQVLLTLIGHVFILYDVYYINESSYGKYLSLTRKITIFSASIACIIQSAISTIGTAFWNASKWNLLLKQCSEMERALGIHAVNSPQRKTNYVLFITTTALILFNSLFKSIKTIIEKGFSFQTKFLLFHYLVLAQHIRMFITFLLTRNIKRNFQTLNNLLEQRYERNQGISLHTAGTVYRKLFEMVELFNSLLGPQEFVGFLQCSVMSINYFNIALLVIRERYLSDLAILPIVMIGLSILIGPILVTFSCDQVVREAEKLSKICYKYQEKFPTYSEEKQLLLVLANQAVDNRPVITAAGFFEINRVTLFALFGSLATYFILILQFNQM